ncbi:MAG: phosphohistidine phosphatase SixA [Verrucomicrobia bacterium]|nr:phosphohistidine phosphatase SixA [Verrucomicrobiota bacterium]
MNLYFLRHGLAEARTAANLRTDARRPLTAKGVKRMRKIARAIKAMDLSFDLILSSPYVRAQQTAEIVAAELNAHKRVRLADELGASAHPKDTLASLAHLRPAPKDLLLVGHEPHLSSLISVLLSGSSAIETDLKKGGLCKLSLGSVKPPQRATLEWLLTPKQMTLMA